VRHSHFRLPLAFVVAPCGARGQHPGHLLVRTEFLSRTAGRSRPGRLRREHGENPIRLHVRTEYLRHTGVQPSHLPDIERDTRFDHGGHERRMQTSRSNGYAGSRLNRSNGLGRHRRKGQPWSRTGENPPSGILGGMEETSASFEARYAPPSYPTTSFPAVSRQRSTSILS
jgi:hypothetical protein